MNDCDEDDEDETTTRARNDLDRHIGSARSLLFQASGDELTAVVVATATLIRAESMTRDRLASLLAVALVRLAADSPGETQE